MWNAEKGTYAFGVGFAVYRGELRITSFSHKLGKRWLDEIDGVPPSIARETRAPGGGGFVLTGGGKKGKTILP